MYYVQCYSITFVLQCVHLDTKCYYTISRKNIDNATNDMHFMIYFIRMFMGLIYDALITIIH